MAILCTINASKAVTWKDTSGVIWKGTADVVWKSQDDSGTLYLSLNGEDLTHYWDGWIKSFGSPQYKTASDYGGFVDLSFGTIVFSSQAFESNWRPPKQLTIKVEYTATTEAAAVEVFAGDIYLVDFDKFNVSYDIKAPKYTQRLLAEGADYNGDTVPYPKAFGPVTHVEPLRVADNASRPTYHLGGISTTADAKTILCFTSSAAGAKTKVTLDAAHGWSNGASIYIAGTVNFDGAHTIESVSGATFVIPTTYPTDTSETLPIHASAFASGSFAVFDDGVPIQENVVVIGDGTFALSSSPVGTVTMSGTPSSLTTLLEVVTWGQGRLTGVGSIVSTNSRGTSPNVSYWATEQMPLIDFLSDICAFFTHYFFIKSSILTLGDMLLDNGSETLTEGDYFRAGYSAHNAVSQLKASWVTHEAFNGFVDEVRKARYVKEIKNTVVESLNTVSSGTADGTATGQLVNSGATFSTDGVAVGDVAQNTTDDTFTIVTAVSEGALELEDDIFISGEAYVVGPSFPNANPMTVDPYHTTKSNVSTALQNILTVLSKDVAEVSIPLSATLPDPGKKETFPDTKLIVDTTTYIRARSLIYDFDSDVPKVILKGEGVIS